MKRPFDKTRYARLLEGLEVTVLKLSDVAAFNVTMRLDAEYFSKANLAALSSLRSLPNKSLGELAFVTDGIHASIQFQEGSGIRVLSAMHPKDNFLDLSQCEEISWGQHEQNPRTALRESDVLISTVGTIGNAATVTPDVLPANSDRHVGIIRCKPKLPPEFLSTFLVSRYGRIQSIREATGNVQLNLFISKLRDIVVPLFSVDFTTRIAEAVQSAHTQRLNSERLLIEAQATLADALGLSGWQPVPSSGYTRPASQAFAAGRFDAEYFHPDKKAALDLLASLPSRTVGEMFRSVRKLWNPAGSTGPTLIRNFDLTHALSPFLDDSVEPAEIEAIRSTKKFVQKGDLLVSRLRSYLREIAIVLCDGEWQVASTEFIVLRPRSGDLEAGALLIYLRSLLPQLIFKWSQDGSNHPRFDEKVLLDLRVPNVVLEIQDSLAKSFSTAVEQRRHARELLAVAQRALEVAIEEDETAALAHLAGRVTG